MENVNLLEVHEVDVKQRVTHTLLYLQEVDCRIKKYKYTLTYSFYILFHYSFYILFYTIFTIS